MGEPPPTSVPTIDDVGAFCSPTGTSPYILFGTKTLRWGKFMAKTRGIESFCVFVLSFILLSLNFLVVSGCSQKNQKDPGPKSLPAAQAVVEDPSLAYLRGMALTNPQEWEKRWWISKTAKRLKNGRGLNPTEIERLAALPKEQILDELMKGPDFLDTILDFNLYFLGGKRDRLHTEKGLYQSSIFDFPQAIASAQEMGRSADYLKLLDGDLPFYMAQLNEPFPPSDSNPPPPPGTDPEVLRKMAMDYVIKELETFLGVIESQSPMDWKAFCPLFQKSNVVSHINRVGVPSDLFFATLFDPNWYRSFTFECIAPKNEIFDFAGKIKDIIQQNKKLFQLLSPYTPDKYAPTTVDQIKAFDYSSAFGFKLLYPFDIARKLPNSSTNYNRKRAAYILKTYFCDDLTPINVEAPAQHAKGPHGSETSCYACHYKLDPMAGFFKDYGLLLISFAKLPVILFDDMATIDKATYDQNWNAPDGASRPWNIGYVRSPKFENLNEYGSDYSDLVKIIRKAPEVRSCLVRRMFGYFVNEEQVIDPGYLDYVSQKFMADEKANSSVAFKNALSQILLSQVYSTRDPQADICYDFPPGVNPVGRPPCGVAAILEKNCVSCHSSTAGFGRLDLSKWVSDGHGKMNFPHLDGNGQQMASKDTFSRMLDRLSATDEAIRMPLFKFMLAKDREQLYGWLNNQIQLNGAANMKRSSK